MSVAEKQLLLQEKHSHIYTENEEEWSPRNPHNGPKEQFSSRWGGTPGLRQQWNKESDHVIDFVLPDSDEETGSDHSVVLDFIGTSIGGIPGLVIAITLNLFLSISFGQAFFPASWTFPSEVSRAVGIQMFLFSTVICQIVMTKYSDFPCAMGMMMVENIPFMHTIAQTVIDKQGEGIESFSTVLVAFALSSIVVGVFFYVLGFFKLGNAVYFFPRHVIVGCIGGVGVFVAQTGFEVSTNKTWNWNLESVGVFGGADIWPLWATSCAFELVLRLLLIVFRLPLLPPFYFVLIPPAFYVILFIVGFPIAGMQSTGWFFQSAENSDFTLMWQLIDFRTVRWDIIAELIPTIIALTIFSLMHVPINIPSLSISTKTTANMNRELRAHGVSNIIVGALGGLQNYLCYSNS
jgi:sulfate permease, SulP family